MSEKKKKIYELAAQGNLSRAEIAKQAGCSAPFVTQTLGALRHYRKRQEAAGTTQGPQVVSEGQ